MNVTFRNVAIGAGGVIVVAIAANILRNAQRARRTIAQVMTVVLPKESAAHALTDDVICEAAGCLELSIVRNTDERVFEWQCASHGRRHAARLALLPAPGDRGTELHISATGKKYEIKEVVRRMKYLIEAGEIPTGART